MCYSYRDREEREQARKTTREREDRRREEERQKKDAGRSAPEKERELIRS